MMYFQNIVSKTCKASSLCLTLQKRYLNDTIRFHRNVSNKEVEKYNFNSTERDVIPLYQYFLKFSCFHVKLPPIDNIGNNRNNNEYFPFQDLQCSWNFVSNYRSIFGTISRDETKKKKLNMSEYEFTTARNLVSYLRNFPFIYTENENLNEQELNELIDVELDDRYRNIDKVADIKEMYYKMFEEKMDLMYNDLNNMIIKLPLQKNVAKDLIRIHKVNINGHTIDRTEFFVKANDEIIITVPTKEITENCQRRLFEYLFKLYQIYNRKNDSIEQFLNSSQFRTTIKKTKKLTKYPSQSIELMQKICIQRFNDNIVHGIRHCIIPNDCGISSKQKNDIIIFEDEDIIICNKPSGMAVHFAKETQKYHNNSLINFLLYYSPHLRTNIQKDSNLLKSSKLQNANILPGQINELQLTISPGMIHRIDRQTSGLIVIAKTIFSMSDLLKQWKYHQNIEREYITLVHGKFDGNELRLKYDDYNNEHDNGDDYDYNDDIYSHDVAYSTFYQQEEFEQLYGEYYSQIKMQNDKKNFQFGFSDQDYYKCENWIGPKILGRHLPLKCYNTKDYKQQKALIKEGKLIPFKISCTHFYKLREYNINGHTFTLLKCILITGRTHQVRLHLQYLGMSVVGDRIYPRISDNNDHIDNSRKWRPRFSDQGYLQQDVQIEQELFNMDECENIDWFQGDHHALHAHTLKFQHPTTEEILNYKVDLPPFFQKMLKLLESHNNLQSQG